MYTSCYALSSTYTLIILTLAYHMFPPGIGVLSPGREHGAGPAGEKPISPARAHKNGRLEEERVTPIEARSPVKII